jgi:2-C-methyl-D-erythritol 4-phosphate cytidylyltransferase
VVVAAGAGSRFGAEKQYGALAGRRVVDWSMEACRSVADAVVLVVPASRTSVAEPGADVVVAGGATRSASVRAGLAALPSTVEVVVVHDAARPMATPALFRAVVVAVEGGADGAAPGLPVADTLKRVDDDGEVLETVDRSGLVAVQTPQAFRVAMLRRAHAAEGDATDDAALVEAAGGRVVVVPGDPRNRKLTTPDDLAIAQGLLHGTRA